MDFIRRHLASQSGFTLIEVMTVVVIATFLTLITVTIVTKLMESNIMANQLFAEQQEISSTYNLLSIRLASAQPQIGLRAATTSNPCNGFLVAACIDPLTIAGDQLVFRANRGDDLAYYRVWYDKARDEIRMASHKNVMNIVPRRGPSEAAAVAADPILDGNPPAGVNIVTLAANVSDAPDAGVAVPSDAPNPFVLFEYLDHNYDKLNETPLASSNNGFDTEAVRGLGAGGGNLYYNTLTRDEDAYAVKVNGYFSPPGVLATGKEVKGRFDTQTIELRQICQEIPTGS